MPIARNGDIEIYYEIHGQGEPLVLINGLGGDHTGLKLHQMPAFTQAHYRCIILDNRGIGRSSMPDEPYTTLDMAADVASVLRDAGCPHAHIAGWSMGGAVAQHLAIHYPHHVKTLQLHCTWPRTDPYLAWQFDRRRAALTGIGREELFRTVLLSTFTPAYFNDHAAEMEPAISAMLNEGQQPGYSYLRQLDACTTHDAEDGLSAIKVPVLITSGAEDPLIGPRFARQLNALLPGATLKLIQAAHGHSLERPDEFSAVCLEFLRTHPPAVLSAGARNLVSHRRLRFVTAPGSAQVRPKRRVIAWADDRHHGCVRGATVVSCQPGRAAREEADCWALDG